MLGDGISGFARVRDATGWFYWVAMGVGALVWVLVVVVRRLTARQERVLQLAMTAVAAAAVVIGLQLLELVLS